MQRAGQEFGTGRRALRDLVDRRKHLLARFAQLLLGDGRELGGGLVGDLEDMMGVAAELLSGRVGLVRDGVSSCWM